MSETHEPREAGSSGNNPVRAAAMHRTVTFPWPVWLGLILAIAALVFIVAGALALRTFEKQQATQLAALNGDLQTLGQQLDTLEKSAAPRSLLDSEISDTQQSLKSFNDRLDSMDAALTDLRRRSEEGRDAWIKAEAATLLMAANEQITLYANPAQAARALQAADERLRLLSDPRLLPVRQEIAREQTALRGVPQADLDGMALTLASLAENVNTLRLKDAAPEHYVPGTHADALTETPTLWQKLKAAVSRLLHDLFTIRHRNTPAEPLLAPKEEFFLRRNLELRLDAARAALLDRDAMMFQNSVHTAHSWLQTYFDPRDRAVRAGIDALSQMQHRQINPPLPDISASLTLLRQLESPRKSAP